MLLFPCDIWCDPREGPSLEAAAVFDNNPGIYVGEYTTDMRSYVLQLWRTAELPNFKGSNCVGVTFDKILERLSEL